MEHERTSVIVSSLVIEHEGRMLFLEESREEGVRLNLPGGHADVGESPEEVAIREGKEETGFDLNIESCVGALANTWNSGHSVRFIYRATILSGDPAPEIGTTFHWLSLQDFRSNVLDIEHMRGLDEIVDLVERNADHELKLLDYRKKS